MELIERASAGGGPVLESAALLHTFRELPAPVPRRGDAHWPNRARGKGGDRRSEASNLRAQKTRRSPPSPR